MSLSMYQASIPVFVKQLGNLSAILKKAEEHALARKIEPEIFINALKKVFTNLPSNFFFFKTPPTARPWVTHYST